MRGYAVGGKNVLDSWFNYRKATPGGKKTSPLDLMHVSEWDADWTGELIDLLSVLNRLVELEPEQADVLELVLAGPVLTMADLTAAGVKWPTSDADRKVRRALPRGGEDGTLDLSGEATEDAYVSE